MRFCAASNSRDGLLGTAKKMCRNRGAAPARSACVNTHLCRKSVCPYALSWFAPILRSNHADNSVPDWRWILPCSNCATTPGRMGGSGHQCYCQFHIFRSPHLPQTHDVPLQQIAEVAITRFSNSIVEIHIVVESANRLSINTTFTPTCIPRTTRRATHNRSNDLNTRAIYS